MLEAADQLALDHRHNGHDPEDHGEDHQRLDDHDPGRFDELRVGQRDHLTTFSIVTSTGPPLSRALALPSLMPSIRKQVPAAIRSLTSTLAVRLLPFCATFTSSPSFRSRR